MNVCVLCVGAGCCSNIDKGEVYVTKKGSAVVVNPMSSSAFQTAVVVVERCEKLPT